MSTKCPSIFLFVNLKDDRMFQDILYCKKYMYMFTLKVKHKGKMGGTAKHEEKCRRIKNSFQQRKLIIMIYFKH